MRLNISNKLMLACAVFGLLPLSVVSVISWQSANRTADRRAQEYHSAATNIGDLIDRNLFERYGDVQAFGLNKVVQDRDYWYRSTSDNAIAKAMNSYVDTYDIYYLTLLVDTEGELIAVNTADDSANPIDTKHLYDVNFSDASWFKDALAGNFYKSEDGSFTGTVVEHLYVDEQVRSIYGDEGLSLGFAAPVRDEEGNVIAVWKNVAKFSTVEEIVEQAYQTLKSRGTGGAEITVLDEKGNIIVDMDPARTGSESVIRDLSIIGKFNLAEKGVEAAQRVCQGESSCITKSFHARKGIYQCAGFAPLKGALGFPGMKWSVMVRVPQSEALALSNGIKSSVVWTGVVGLSVILLGAYLLARSFTRPIKSTMTAVKAAANGDFSVRPKVLGSGELKDMNVAVEQLLDTLAANEVKNADYEGQLAAIGKSQAVIEFNMDGTIITANENFLGAVGYTLEEIQGQHHRIFCEAEYANSPEYVAFWEKLGRGEFEAGEFKRIGKGGNEIWIQASYNPIFDVNGKPYKVVKYASDITAQVEQRGEAFRLRTVVDTAEAAFMMVNRDFVVTYVNEATKTLLNKHLDVFRAKWPTFDPSNIIGACIDDFHANPKHQRDMLSDPSVLPIKTDIQVGPLTIGLVVTAQYDAEGNYVGNTLEWSDVTEERQRVAREQKIAEFQAAEVETLSDVMSKIAKGDLTQAYQVAEADRDTQGVWSTFNDIATQVNTMCTNLREVMTLMMNNAGTLATSSDDLSGTADKLESGASDTTTQSAAVSSAAEEMSINMKNMAATTEQMTSNVKSVAASIEEMTASISEIAKNAEQASSVAGNAASLAENSNLTISQLGSAADEIGKVIEVIQDIAEQTNLLALNATIEAARAGDAGKGFAVVATEVKELAKQTAGATEDIRNRIVGIQGSTQEVVQSIDEIGKVISEVNSVSTTIAAAVEEQSVTTKEIARNVSQTSEAAASVSTGVSESASASEEITRSITEVDQAAKSTASAATLTKETGVSLSSLATELQGLVGKFNV